MKLVRLNRVGFHLSQAEISAYDAYNALERVRGFKKLTDRAFALYCEAEALRIEITKATKAD